MIELEKHIVYPDDKLFAALEKLNQIPENLTLFVLDRDKKLVGTLTDGDIRRGLLRKIPVDSRVSEFMSTEFASMNGNTYSVKDISRIKKRGVRLLPVIDNKGRISRVVDFSRTETVLPVDAFLMAGGRGERLLPLTAKTPKPLLKLGDKPIIDHIIKRLTRYGICNYTISLRYLGEQIENYIGDGSSQGINVRYLYETDPLGTIGSLSLAGSFSNDVILLMNADLFTNIDFEDFYNRFIEEDADMAIASVPYIVDIPYAILEEDESVVRGLKEKPRKSFHANAGIYLVKKSITGLLKQNEKCDAPEFIQRIIESGKKVVRYPIIGYWIDIGKPDDYNKASEFASHLKD